MTRDDWGSGALTKRVSKLTGRVTYQAQFSFEGQRYSKTFRTRALASAWLRQQRHDKEAGTLAAPSRVSVKDLLDSYRESLTIRPNSVTSYIYLTQLLTPLHSVEVQKLRGHRIDATLKVLADDGVAASTRKNARALLNSACRWAVKKGVLLRNPVETSDAVPQVKSTKTTWTAAQAHAFIDATAADPLGTFWHFLLESGLRLNTALALRWCDVDLEQNWFTARGQFDQRHGPVKYVPNLKTEDQHALPIGASLRAKFQAELDRQRLTRIWKPTGYVFNQNGRPLRETTVRREFDAAIARTKLPRITLHGCRHAAGSILLSKGADLKVIQVWLGHSTIKTTADTYLHLDRADLEAASKLLDQALSG